MTAEETIASLEIQLKQALERLGEVTEQLRIAQARIEELELHTNPDRRASAGQLPHVSVAFGGHQSGTLPGGH